MKKIKNWMMIITLLLATSCNNTERTEIEDANIRKLSKEMQETAEWLLSDVSTFEMDFENSQDSIAIIVVESPDGNVRFYEWFTTWTLHDDIEYDGDIYQTKQGNAVRSFDDREHSICPRFIKAIRQIESKNGTIYLLFYQSDRCGVVAYKMDRNGKLVPANVFKQMQEDHDIPEYIRVSKNRIECDYIPNPPSMWSCNGWHDDFFFDITGEDFYFPSVNIPAMRDINDFFDDYYHVFHWDGTQFYYNYTSYNPKLAQFIDESHYLVCEFEVGNSFIRIDRMEDGTYRYISWDKEEFFSSKPELIIENGWFHEVKREFHFTNQDLEYIIELNSDNENASIQIYQIDKNCRKKKEIANNKIEYIYNQYGF